MSLLLDALKRAEKAKEEAQRRAQSDAAGGAPQEAAADAEPPRTVGASDRPPHVRTRAELPDISQSLEIATEDLSARSNPQEGSSALTLESIEAPPPPPPATRQRAASASSEGVRGRSAERAAARKVFEAKMREPNPRLPFYIALGVLGAVALGTVIYFWYQLRPPAPLVNANPPPASTERPVAVAPSGGAAQNPAPSGAAAASQGEIPGLPAVPVAPVAPREPQTQVKAPALRMPTRAAPQALQAPPAAPAPRVVLEPRRSADLTIKRPTPRLDPAISAGYAAYQAGDLAGARSHYEQALQHEPGNRDALLGMAALEMRAQRYDSAESYYRRLLQADPRDSYALAGILALRGQQVDPVLAESRVKTMLAADSGADVLYFTLGNQYARQGRWAEAQQAYFKALAADPGNPDFAYNLAVSLEHIGKPKLALEQYHNALALAQHRSFSFDQAAAQKRVQELGH